MAVEAMSICLSDLDTSHQNYWPKVAQYVPNLSCLLSDTFTEYPVFEK